MINVKLILAYDGSAYLGWQHTKEGPSIEEALWKVLDQMRLTPEALHAASRTDKGVHARGQVVNVLLSKKEIHPDKLFLSLNRLLPDDISVLDLQIVSENFHATTDSIQKEYHYEISTAPFQMPQDRYTCWHYPYLLDLEKMEKAAEKIIGERDFRVFCNMRKNLVYPHYRRDIDRLEIVPVTDKKFLFKIVGHRFLYKMVRNIVGLLVYVGRGLIPLEHVEGILSSQDRRQGAITAPAHGLTLHEVKYAEILDNPSSKSLRLPSALRRTNPSPASPNPTPGTETICIS